MEGLTQTVLNLSATPWGLAVLLVCCQIDGFFPPLPSEAIVTALAAMSVSGQGPHVGTIVAVAAVGAFLGDLTAYAIGRRTRITDLRPFRSGKGRRLREHTEHALATRAAELILAARFVPGGRVAVTMSAGSLRFPPRRFAMLAALSATVWASYTTLLGIGAGSAFRDNPWLAAAVGIVVGLVVGFVVDSVTRRRRAQRQATGTETVSDEWESPEPVR